MEAKKASKNPRRPCQHTKWRHGHWHTGATASAYTTTYNLAGRLTTLTKSGVTTTSAYDSSGRRIRKFISTGMGAGAGAASTVATNPPRVYYVNTDHLNTPRVVFDTANRVRWRWLAEPFGTTAPETNPSNLGSFTQNLRFPGQYADQESGLFYNHNRDYDPGIGRYIQFDPIGLDGGPNGFAYASANPLSFVDPDGLQFLDLTTIAGLRRETTLDDAVRAGAWTRAITMPIVTAGLTPSAIGLVGSASAPLFCAAPETITVSRWGRKGLEAGDWVMKGGVIDQKQI